MIEEGKVYKLKKIKGFDNNEDCDCEILKILDSQNPQLGKVAYYKTEDGRHYVAPVSEFVDPEDPQEYSNITFQKLESVMKPMNLTFWKELKEDAMASLSAAVPALAGGPTGATGMINLGTLPTGCKVNGLAVAGTSVKSKKKKKKKSKKNEEAWLADGPEATFHDADDKEIEFEDAINLIRYGQTEDELDEYKEYLDLFKRHDCEKEYLEYAFKEYGLSLFDLSPNAFGLRETVAEKPLLVKFEQACKDFEEGKISFEEYDNILNEYKDMFNKLVYGIDKNSYIENYIQCLLNEDFNEAYERITNLLAKQLDRMNFEFANTEEIIYKKEGDTYRYLLKFDNQQGILKFKISKGEDTLEEKQWELEEKEDVTPIFQEIEDLYNKYGL